MDIERIVAQLKIDEGFAQNAYWDRDHFSIGFGTPALGAESVISYKEAEVALEHHLSIAIKDFETLYSDCRDGIDEVRAEALVQLCYNMGRARVRGFRKMNAAIRKQDWLEAGYQLQDSKWYITDLAANARARRLVRQLATGEVADAA